MTSLSLWKTFLPVSWGSGSSQICVGTEPSRTDSSLKGVPGAASVSTSGTCLLNVSWCLLLKPKCTLIPSGDCRTSCASLSYRQPLIRGSVLSRFLQASTLVFSRNMTVWSPGWKLALQKMSKSCYWTQSKNKVMKFYGLCYARDRVKWFNVQIIKLWLIIFLFAEGKVVWSFEVTGRINVLIV